MTSSERTAYSIAKQFVEAVRRMEDFYDDPDFIYDDIALLARHEPDKVVRTLTDLTDLLSGKAQLKRKEDDDEAAHFA